MRSLSRSEPQRSLAASEASGQPARHMVEYNIQIRANNTWGQEEKLLISNLNTRLVTCLSKKDKMPVMHMWLSNLKNITIIINVNVLHTGQGLKGFSMQTSQSGVQLPALRSCPLYCFRDFGGFNNPRMTHKLQMVSFLILIESHNFLL